VGISSVPSLLGCFRGFDVVADGVSYACEDLLEPEILWE
jgi:hypothetical protein